MEVSKYIHCVTGYLDSNWPTCFRGGNKCHEIILSKVRLWHNVCTCSGQPMSVHAHQCKVSKSWVCDNVRCHSSPYSNSRFLTFLLFQIIMITFQYSKHLLTNKYNQLRPLFRLPLMDYISLCVKQNLRLENEQPM